MFKDVCFHNYKGSTLESITYGIGVPALIKDAELMAQGVHYNVAVYLLNRIGFTTDEAEEYLALVEKKPVIRYS